MLIKEKEKIREELDQEKTKTIDELYIKLCEYIRASSYVVGFGG